LFSFIAFQLFLFRIAWLLAITVMALVVEHENVFHAHELGHNALDHLPFGLGGFDFSTSATLHKRTTAFGAFEALAGFERVKIGDDDLGSLDFLKQVLRDQLPASVIAVWVIGLQYAQAVLNSKTRRHNEEPASEMLTAGPANGIDGLPSDEHGYY